MLSLNLPFSTLSANLAILAYLHDLLRLSLQLLSRVTTLHSLRQFSSVFIESLLFIPGCSEMLLTASTKIFSSCCHLGLRPTNHLL